MNFDGKILIADDEPHVRKYIGLIAKQLGTPIIVEAKDGHDAYDVFVREKPDVVLLDVNMPVQDGIETLKQIMTVDPSAIVIMLTSLANRETIEETLQFGAANYIRKDTPKDIILAELRQTIDQCFEHD